MDIKVITGEIDKIEAGAVIVPFFEEAEEPEGDAAEADRLLEGAITQLVRQKEIKGKLNEVTVIYSLGKLPSGRVVVAGLGKKADVTVNKIRSAVAEACRRLRSRGVESVAVPALGSGAAGITDAVSAQAVTEGAILGLYSFRKHMTKPAEGEITQLIIFAPDSAGLAALQQGYEKGRILAEAAIFARDMVNEPSNHMTPTAMAGMATRLAHTHGLELTILEREQMRTMGMGAILGVAQGSELPPKFIVLRYKGTDSGETDVALIGKAITFDSGGISIKPSEGMGDMKGDMAGGASVMAAMGAIAQFRPKINVMAVIPATENLPSGSAFKPGDILKSMSGKTIEIITTDAEGRLTLADALEYARKQGAKRVVDIATLTGAVRVALGTVCTGAFSNNKEMEDRVIAAGAEAGELVWPMPMYDDYKEQNKSEVADLQNSGGRNAGAITAAQFLAEFAGDTPWVHLDIAGTSMSDKERGYTVKGATGVPVRTLVNFVLAMQK